MREHEAFACFFVYLLSAADQFFVACRWQGKGVAEVGVCAAGPRKGDVVVRVDAKYFRPTEVELLLGNPTKAKNLLHWDPFATSLQVRVSSLSL